MYVKFNVSTQDTEATNVCQIWCVYTGYRGDECMSSVVCLHRIQRRRMYVKLSVPTQDTQKTNVCGQFHVKGTQKVS